MKVGLLTPYPERFGSIFRHDNVTVIEDGSRMSFPDGYVVSYGYRRIVPPHIIAAHKDRIINVHIGLLPWNRGADPNFWSWYDDTPKGVTIHYMDNGLDTGDIIMQAKVRWLRPEKETLHSTYWELNKHAMYLLKHVCTYLRSGRELPKRIVQDLSAGTSHKSHEMPAIMDDLPEKWHTPVLKIAELGQSEKDGGNNVEWLARR